MANLSLTRVNQKLAQARVLLEADIESLTQVHRNSLIEAACFHMVCAYSHYLRELAETYGLKGSATLDSEAQLVAAFQAAHRHPAEVQELIELRADERAWLAQLQRYYSSLWQQPKIAKAQDDHTLINLVEVEIQVPDFPTLKEWHANFVALVRRQRETSAEF